jgi:hypothetical protein
MLLLANATEEPLRAMVIKKRDSITFKLGGKLQIKAATDQKNDASLV